MILLTVTEAGHTHTTAYLSDRAANLAITLLSRVYAQDEEAPAIRITVEDVNEAAYENARAEEGV